MKATFFLLGLLIIGLCLGNLTSKREGFITSDYATCMSKGYTKEFCVQTPYASTQVGSCLCHDGNLGLLMPGFRGECVCSSRFFGFNDI